MARIIFIPFPETGHFNAGFKLAKSLQSRGHDVYYLALRDFEDVLRFQGLGFAPMFETVFPRGFLHHQVVLKSDETRDALFGALGKMDQSFDPLTELDRAIRELRPDLLIIDLLLPEIALAAKQTGVSIVLLNTQCYDPWQDREERYEPLEDTPELILCPEEFDFPRSTMRERCYYVEASIDQDRREPQFAWGKLAPDSRLVYCSLGTQSHLIQGRRQALQAIIDAISIRSGWQLVLATGSDPGPGEFTRVGSNTILVEKAPQLSILRRASIVITHGGFNTVKECIFFGVPTIVFPLVRDHPAIAARIAHHGLGLRGNFKNISAESVNSMIDRLDGDPVYRTRVCAMRDRFREIEDAGRAVKIIELILNDPIHTR
jgi:UDP:flavonoid glycosyltransferase YjiC (YdhE family)